MRESEDEQYDADPRLTRKGFMLVRLLTLCQILENARYPRTVRELREEVNHRMIWDWSEKTLRRDMAILERLRVVEEVNRAGEFAFCWLGLHNLDPRLL